MDIVGDVLNHLLRVPRNFGLLMAQSQASVAAEFLPHEQNYHLIKVTLADV
jgi:hypothetical protein